MVKRKYKVHEDRAAVGRTEIHRHAGVDERPSRTFRTRQLYESATRTATGVVQARVTHLRLKAERLMY